jgi:hypothetical protein
MDKAGGISKITRYKWTTTGERAEFQYIDKRLIEVDETYQRPQSRGKARDIASNWSWAAFGALSVNQRHVNGQIKFFVLDGQHRAMAAMLRPDVTEVPCLIFQLQDVREEADAFWNINKNRRMLRSMEIYNADLVRESPSAQAVNVLIQKAGRHAAKNSSATTISCVGILRDLWEADKDRLEKLWPLVCEFTKQRPLHKDMISGIFNLEGHMNKEDYSLLEPSLSKRLMKIGYDEIMRSILETGSFMGTRSARTCAIGILRALNRGMRTKLSIASLSSNEAAS